MNHAFVNNRIVGPDRFRFVTSYWTTSDVSRLIDAGRSAGNITSSAGDTRSTYVAPGVTNQLGPVIIPRAGITSTTAGLLFSQAASTPLSNLQVEVDRGEGYSTLAIVLQYEGVVSLAGITAGLKLPTGFEAQYPLTDDRHNSDIALANYDGGIRPSQEIVLYFPMYVLPNAPVQIPVLGPLAMHFLRNAPRSVTDSLGTTEQNMFAKVLTITNGANQTIFNNNLGLNKNYSDKSGRLIPFDFINQVIPVIFKATGREVLDVYQATQDHLIPTLPGPSCVGSLQSPQGVGDCKPSSTNGECPTPNGKPLTSSATNNNKEPAIRDICITLSNHGDVPLFNLVVQFNTVVPVITGQSGSFGGVIAPQLPIVIQGPSTFYFTGLGPGQNETIRLPISTAIDCNTNQLLQADSSFNNVIGVRAEQIQNIGLTTTGPGCSQQAGTNTGVFPGGTFTPSEGAPPGHAIFQRPSSAVPALPSGLQFQRPPSF